MASYLIPVSISDDGDGPDVEIFEPIVVTIKGLPHKCRCLGWKLLNPLDALTENERRYVIKTDIQTSFGNYDAPLETVQISITRREAKLRELISGLNESKNS